jgi:hypothetical protein
MILMAAWPARATAPSLQITAVPKLDEDKRKAIGSAGQVAVGIMNGHYKVIVKNLSFMDETPALIAKYRFFVLRDDGKKNLREVKPQRIEGTADIVALKPGATADFETSAVKLSKTSLDQGYYYTNNQRQSTKDTLDGIWLRIYDGDKMVAEFLSSSKLPKLGPF